MLLTYLFMKKQMMEIQKGIDVEAKKYLIYSSLLLIENKDNE